MNALWQDLRFAARTLMKSPGFTLVAVISLALGIGAVTSVYSMVSAVLINSAPFEDADRLVAVKLVYPSQGTEWFGASYPDFRDWQEQNQVFEYMAGYTGGELNLSGPEGPERVRAGRVSADFFRVLRVKPQLGRDFLAEEDKIGANPVVVLSHALWERRYNSRPDIVGQGITVHGEPFTVIGVAPPSFRFLSTGNADVWVPLTNGTWFSDKRRTYWFRAMGRMKEGVTREQAEAEMKVIAARLGEQYPETNADKTVRLTPINEEEVGDVQVAFYILFGAVAFVLLIACVNVADLLLARAASRQKEVAIRIALGASRARLIRQLLTESLLLAALGGALGLLVTLWGNDFIFSLLPPAEAQFYADYFRFGVNQKVLLFTAGVVLATAILFGLVPALQASRPNVSEFLKEGGAAAGVGAGRHRLLGGLVVSEVALAIVLLVGAGLMIQSFQRLQKEEPGFEPRHLLTASVSLPETAYPEGEAGVSFFERLIEQLEATGGVERAAAASIIPFTRNYSNNAIHVEGYPPLPPGQYYLAEQRAITPHFFEAMGTPVLSGRAFSSLDRNSDSPVAIIDETFAAKFWPNEDPIGKRFKPGTDASENKWMTVVGVVGNVRRELAIKLEPTCYVPLAQSPHASLRIVVRTLMPPEGLTPSLRGVLASLDPTLPLSQVETMEDLMRVSLWEQQMNATLLSIFAGVALLLASVGVYGVIGYSVAQRTHEIGVRMALGAQTWDVRWMVVRQGLKLAVMGVVIGMACAVGLTRLMTSLLYDVSPTDPLTFAAVAVVLLVVAVLASYLPARRATKIDPMTALRYE